MNVGHYGEATNISSYHIENLQVNDCCIGSEARILRLGLTFDVRTNSSDGSLL